VIAASLGTGPAFDVALGEFAQTYTDQNEHDYQALTERHSVRVDRGRGRAVAAAAPRQPRVFTDTVSAVVIGTGRWLSTTAENSLVSELPHPAAYRRVARQYRASATPGPGDHRRTSITFGWWQRWGRLAAADACAFITVSGEERAVSGDADAGRVWDC